MRLSTILKESQLTGQFRICGETEFETLGLASAEPDKSVCTFIDDIRFAETVSPAAAVILTDSELFPVLQEKFGEQKGYCIVEDPRLLFFKLHNYLAGYSEYVRPIQETVVGNGCSISGLAYISENNVIIGNDVTIEEFAVIKENTVIGDHAVIRAGAVIGGQGFEFKKAGKGILAVEHLGGVRIKDFAEIQYNTCVDKAVYPWDDTVVGAYTKLDNLVHIGHGAKVGDRVMIVAQSGIGGRTVVGDDTWIGFGATVRNGIEIGVNARVNMGAVVSKPVLSGQSVTGNFAIEHKVFIEDIKTRVRTGGGIAPVRKYILMRTPCFVRGWLK